MRKFSGVKTFQSISLEAHPDSPDEPGENFGPISPAVACAILPLLTTVTCFSMAIDIDDVEGIIILLDNLRSSMVLESLSQLILRIPMDFKSNY